jgi:lipopolysaccharide transport system permease protein
MNGNDWSTTITPRRGWFDLNLRDLWRYRDLITLFARRDFVTVYKQTILGPFWFLLQPLVSTLVFTVIFGKIIGVSTGGVPPALFYLSGIVVWNFFAACLTRTADTLVANAGLFGKVYFPRLCVPVSTVAVNLITFMIQFGLFVAFAAYFHLSGAPVRPNALLLLLPLLVLQMGALGLGVGILVSSLTTKYRDLAFLTGFAVQLWMYATPIVYPLELVPKAWQWVFALNPMTVVVETFRQAFWGGGSPDPARLALSLLETVALLVLAVGVFSRVEKTFMDTV